ncbi:MAG: type II secretion system F family protein [Candidatus Omnitrophica bacterium]|nr:MAG: Type II secretion system protein F [Candidatus Hinthialibacteria bacterium OLB16]MCC6733733.1 type II secretion system F family protein [Candidatus Omnitrophota bacterium]MCK6495175.1 type II secretion system F family protein [bacterium]MCL4733822.1 type II secretion system F family protein [Candidatus Omnitrophota bacterium]
MPRFAYKAKRPNGEIVEGILEAENRRLVISKLQGMKVFPITVEEEGGRGLQKEVNFQSLIRIRFTDIVNFTRQLSDLTKAGMPLVRSLDVLIEQTENDKMKNMIRSMKNDVAGGTPFSDALAKFPRQFSDLYSSMVRSGEVGGYLDTVLDRLAEFLEKEADLRSRIRNAMAYPIIMICVALAVIIILTVYVVPTFVHMFEDQKLELPRVTKVLITFSDAIRGYWYLFIAAICMIVYAFRQFVAKPEGRLVIDQAKLHIPVLGDMIRKQEISKFSRTLGTLLGNGVSILKALDVVTAVISNKILADEVAALKGDISEGARLSNKMRQSQIFPPVATNMVAVGEETGELERALLRIAETYETETDRAIKTLVTLIEPLLIVCMALVVGFIVMAMILPIFQLSTAVRG